LPLGPVPRTVGEDGSQGKKGGWERATHVFGVPSLGRKPIACFPEYLTHFGLNSFYEAVLCRI